MGYDLKSALADTTPDYTRFEPGKYWIFLGYEKSGKTTAASTFSPNGEDGVLILDLENGVRAHKKISISISSANTPYTEDLNGEPIPVPPIDRGLRRSGVSVPSYSMVEAIDMLANEWKDSGKTTLVIDTVDVLSDWCNKIAMEEIIRDDALSKNPNPRIQNATCPEDIPFAQAFIKGRVKVGGVVNTLLDIIGDNGILILCTHLKKTSVITEARDVIIKRVPKLPEQTAAMLGHSAEGIAMFDIDEAGNHWVDFRGYSEVLMGTRVAPLQGKKFLWQPSGKQTLYNVLLKQMSKATA